MIDYFFHLYLILLLRFLMMILHNPCCNLSGLVKSIIAILIPVKEWVGQLLSVSNQMHYVMSDYINH